MPLTSFDFKLLDNAEFKEDAVREEIITPLLKSLGYSASPPNQIIRSRSLLHPFVYIGTKKNDIKIIPDYILEVDGKCAWIIDAKSPRENIRKGPNVEQAFCYAIHPDVRVFTYALCNGHELVVFNVSKSHPVFCADMRNLKSCKSELHANLAPDAFSGSKKFAYKPDFGLYCRKVGITGSVAQHFYEIGLPFIIKVNDSKYSAFF